MASPVTVIPTPGDANSHMLFFLNDFKQQLAMEVRPVINPTRFTAFQDNGVPKGLIANPSSLSAVLSNNIPTVYAITQPGLSDKAFYISTVSPYYNPIATGTGVQTTCSAVAACSDAATGNDYVYYIQLPKGQSTYQIIEFRVDGTNTTPSPAWSMTNPSSNTNMAAVYFQATQARFVIYTNTDKKHLIFWVNSTDQSPNPIEGTAGVANASPLAVTSVAGTGSGGPYLELFLYYMDQNQALNRVAGRAQGSSIHWYKNEVPSAPNLLSSTLMAATTTGGQNYVYYIPDGQSTFSPFVEAIQSNWFEDVGESKAAC